MKKFGILLTVHLQRHQLWKSGRNIKKDRWQPRRSTFLRLEKRLGAGRLYILVLQGIHGKYAIHVSIMYWVNRIWSKCVRDVTCCGVREPRSCNRISANTIPSTNSNLIDHLFMNKRYASNAERDHFSRMLSNWTSILRKCLFISFIFDFLIKHKNCKKKKICLPIAVGFRDLRLWNRMLFLVSEIFFLSDSNVYWNLCHLFLLDLFSDDVCYDDVRHGKQQAEREEKYLENVI